MCRNTILYYPNQPTAAPNEDFGRPNKPSGTSFRRTFQRFYPKSSTHVLEKCALRLGVMHLEEFYCIAHLHRIDVRYASCEFLAKSDKADIAHRLRIESVDVRYASCDVYGQEVQNRTSHIDQPNGIGRCQSYATPPFCLTISISNIPKKASTTNAS